MDCKAVKKEIKFQDAALCTSLDTERKQGTGKKIKVP